MASITCGKCKRTHASVAEVRGCYANDPMAQAAAVERGELPSVVVPLTGPNSVASPGSVEVGEGFWKIAGSDTVYKVQRAVHGSGHLYAKRLTVGEHGASWDYAPGVMPMIRLDGHPLTKDEAAEFGKLYGVCCICGRTLTNEESIEAGIGPICAGRQGWA
jgi:hypothetical protein